MHFIFPQKGIESIAAGFGFQGVTVEFDSIDHAILFKQKFNNNPVMAYIEKVTQTKNFVQIHTNLKVDVDFDNQTIKIYTK